MKCLCTQAQTVLQGWLLDVDGQAGHRQSYETHTHCEAGFCLGLAAPVQTAVPQLVGPSPGHVEVLCQVLSVSIHGRQAHTDLQWQRSQPRLMLCKAAKTEDSRL